MKMNIYLNDEQLEILDQIIAAGHARDRETALSFLIFYYNIRQQDLKSNEVA